jgi:mycothiol system anti-sigma-R factor
MSDGKSDSAECHEVLAKVYLYLDSEVDDHDGHTIKDHLDECGPCLRQYGLEQHINQMVARTCGDEVAPDALKSKVLAQIQQVRIEITRSVEVTGE